MGIFVAAVMAGVFIDYIVFLAIRQPAIRGNYFNVFINKNTEPGE